MKAAQHGRSLVAAALFAALTLSATPARAGDDGGGDGPTPSVTPRNELGINPETLHSAGLARVGRPWRAQLDCGAHGPGVAVLSARDAPLFGVVVGAGEILIDVFHGTHLFTLHAPHAGGVATFEIALPDDVALAGSTMHVQGLCGGAPGPRYSNALDVVVGR